MKYYSVKEVMELTGVSRDMLIEYEKRGLIHPFRTGDVANNRRLYREEDIDDLGRVVALRAYDFSLNDIERILGDEQADVQCILKEQLEVLRRRENHLRNLILFAKFIDITDTELFAGILEGPTTIDDLADAVRETELYQKTVQRLQSVTDEELQRMMDELYDIVEHLMTLSEEEGFRGVERCIDQYFAWWGENVIAFGDVGYLGFWAIFEDDSLLAAMAEELGEEMTSADIQMFAFYVYAKRLLLQTQERIWSVAHLAEKDVVAALEAARPLADEVLAVMFGANRGGFTEEMREVCASVLGYLRGMVEDEELRTYIDPVGAITLDASALKKAQSVVELLAVENADEVSGNGASERDEGADLNVKGICDAG